MHVRTRVKICGITEPEDARCAAEAGADAIGLVFYPPSPRAVTIAQAQTVLAKLPPLVSVVALFVNEDAAAVRTVLAQLPITWLQFHGDEEESYCRQFDRPYIKALRMKPEIDVAAEMARYPGAAGFLLDAYKKGVPGGTGEQFDWQRIPLNSEQPIILAGGLNPDNIQTALATSSVYAVDVSGGVECAPGKKDHRKVADFVANVRSFKQ